MDGRSESATSLERLVDGQLRWLLLDFLRLPRDRFAEIPSPDQLTGNLAHALANRVRPGCGSPTSSAGPNANFALYDQTGSLEHRA